MRPEHVPQPLSGLLTAGGIALVAIIDFVSGVELRVYPLYYLPIAFAAWYIGRSWTVAAAALSVTAWMISNYLAGLDYSTASIWVFNSVMHGVSFLVVGVLLAQLKVALAHEKQLSRLDPLTALMNSRAFDEEAARILSTARRKKRPVTLAYIDLDDFKIVNDTHGHHAGDELLRAVAGAIRGSVRVTDLAARIGGDEFALLLPETGHAEAKIALDRLRHRIQETLTGAPHTVTASIGGVVFPAVPDSFGRMVRAADRRMYAAKAAGRDRIVLDVAAGEDVTEGAATLG
jgi:diguanylate cyclase (GGDEF)-like protein